MKRKANGWAKNYYGEQKRKKTATLQTLHDFKKIKDYGICVAGNKRLLEEMYLSEEEYWKLRAKQQ